MKPIKLLAISGAASLCVMSTPAAAVELILDGGFQAFQFDGVGEDWDTEFTFELTTLAELQVTDAFLSGDQFEVFLNGMSQGLTSLPVEGGDIGNDFAGAFADPDFSSGSYLLGPGSYTLTGTVVASPFGGGGAGVQLLSASVVPEPGTWALMLLGFLGVGAALRRRQPKMTVQVGYS